MILSRVAKPFSWVFTGHAGFLASQWLMLVALAKWGSPEFVGSFALALAISSPVIRATGLNFRYVIAADNHPQYSFGDFLGFRLMALGLAVVLLAGGGLLGPIGATTGMTIAIVGLARVFWAISDVYYGLFLQRDETWAIAASLLVRSVLGLTGLGVGLWMTGGVVGAAVGVAVGWLLPVFLVDLPVVHWIGRDADFDSIPRLDRSVIGDLLK